MEVRKGKIGQRILVGVLLEVLQEEEVGKDKLGGGK